MIYPWQYNQWQQVLQLSSLNQLPHALLIHGAAGTGKADFASHLAQSLLCAQPGEDGAACGHCKHCQLIQAGTHPDLSLIRPKPPENSKSQHPVLNIRIDVIRELCRKLADTSQLGGYRIAIIDEAEHMMTQAANALLKTLEEPGSRTLIILVTAHPSRLPITVRSRCQSIRFGVIDDEMAQSWLATRGIQDATRWLNYAHGAPLAALECAEEQVEARQLLADALLSSIKGQSSMSYAQKLAALPRASTLSWLLDWVGDMVKIKQDKDELPIIHEEYRQKLQSRLKTSDTRQLFDYYDQVCRYIRSDGIALNNQLLWENLLISWDNL